MNERKFEQGSRINTADEGTLERSVGLNIFETLNDGLVSKPITPCAAAWAAAFAVRVDTGRVRGILLHPFVRSPHRILEHPAPSHPANPEDPVSGFLLAALRWR